MICAGGTNFPDKPMLEGGAKTWTDRIFTLSPGENGWTEAGTLPAPYAYGASASTREGLLCIGGCGSFIQNFAEGLHMTPAEFAAKAIEIGRASCRERV